MKPSREYWDPAKIIELKSERQARLSCSGCVHWSRLWGMALCARHPEKAGNRVVVCEDFTRRGEAQ